MFLCYYYYMHALDNLKQIKKLDPAKVLASIQLLPKQIEDGWRQAESIKVNNRFKPQQVIINGMGGSGLPAHFVRAVLAEELKIPLTILNGYQLPGWLNNKTLYIIQSYSGNTEEPLSTIGMAQKKQAKIFALTSDGKLGKLIERGELNGLIFNPQYNLCGQPRMGLGYAIILLMAVLKKYNLLKIKAGQIKQLIKFLKEAEEEFNVATAYKENAAKRAAEHIHGLMPYSVAADFLSANAHILANQLNEGAKTLAAYFTIPEMNHHLLEAFSFPKNDLKNLIFFFLESNLYHPRNIERIKITKQVLRKNKINYISYRLQGKDKLSQAFEAIMFNSYVSYYLAILNKVDPAAIPWVNYFKARLK